MAARPPLEAVPDVAGRFDRPIFIISAPRSGSTMLFETMARAPDLFTVGGESHGLIEGLGELAPPSHGWDSNRLDASDIDPEVARRLPWRFYQKLRDRNGKAPTGSVRMLEKTPKNALRVPFLAALFPDAIFLFLHRSARATIGSMVDGWESGYFRTYPNLPGWPGPPWSYLLTPGWRDWAGLPLAEIAARQWASAVTTMLDDLERLDPARVRAVDYGTFVDSPNAEAAAIAEALDYEWDVDLGDALPVSTTTVTRPSQDKWRRHEPALAALASVIDSVDARANAFFRSRT